MVICSMADNRRTFLDSVSNLLFVIGFAASRLKEIPIAILSTILALISIVAYLLGYLAWFLATFFYPDGGRAEAFWYGFAQVKIQYQVTAVIGLIASILCLTLQPTLIVAALWMFTLSNLIWCTAEYHKLHHPEVNEHAHSYDRQAHYLHYTICMTASCLVSCIAATIAFFIPAVIFPAFLVSIIGGNILAALSFYYLGTHATNSPPETTQNLYQRVFDDPDNISRPSPAGLPSRIRGYNSYCDLSSIQALPQVSITRSRNNSAPNADHMIQSSTFSPQGHSNA